MPTPAFETRGGQPVYQGCDGQLWLWRHGRQMVVCHHTDDKVDWIKRNCKMDVPTMRKLYWMGRPNANERDRYLKSMKVQRLRWNW